MENFISIVIKSQNLIRNNDGLTTSDAFEEITKILFSKSILDLPIYTKPITVRALYKNEIYNKFDFFNNENINLSDESILEILKLFQNVSFDEMDVKGKLFETFLGRTFTSGLGQFFTPRNVVDFMVNFLYKFLNKTENIKILDPACGSGGMLLSTSKLFKNCEYYGYDINERISRVARMNLNISSVNTHTIINDSFLNDTKTDFYDLVITNPPFGVKEQKPDLLKNFHFGKNKKSVDLEILFLEKIINSLKEGGVCGIVLPDGIFNNSSAKKIREYLITYCNIISSIDLPSNVFKTSGTGCETSILFFQKKLSNKFTSDQIKCKLYKVDFIGYETSTKFAKEISQNDLNDILNNTIEYVEMPQSSLIDRMDAKFYIRKRISEKYSKYLCKYFINKTDYIKSFANYKEIKYIQYSDIDSHFGRITGCETITEIKDIPNRAKFLVEEGDILIPRLSASNNKIAIVSKEYEGCIASNGFFVLKPIGISKEVLFKILKQPEILQQFKDFSSGTIMPGMDDLYLNDIKFNLPDNSKIIEIERDVKSAMKLLDEAKYLLEK
jgi:type I restriction-modification system DNA methylase subunit